MRRLIEMRRQFVEFVERKLREVGAAKVMPDPESLSKAWGRASRLAKIEKLVENLMQEQEDDEADDPPEGLAALLESRIVGSSRSWDAELWKIAQEEVQ